MRSGGKGDGKVRVWQISAHIHAISLVFLLYHSWLEGGWLVQEAELLMLEAKDKKDASSVTVRKNLKNKEPRHVCVRSNHYTSEMLKS